MKLITEAELQQAIVAAECGDAQSLAKLQATLRAVMERKGPKRACWGANGPLYTLPEIPHD